MALSGLYRTLDFSMPLEVIEKMERETGLEPATSSLGIFVSIENTTPSRSRRSTQQQRNQQLPKFAIKTASYWSGNGVEDSSRPEPSLSEDGVHLRPGMMFDFRPECRPARSESEAIHMSEKPHLPGTDSLCEGLDRYRLSAGSAPSSSGA